MRLETYTNCVSSVECYIVLNGKQCATHVSILQAFVMLQSIRRKSVLNSDLLGKSLNFCSTECLPWCQMNYSAYHLSGNRTIRSIDHSLELVVGLSCCLLADQRKIKFLPQPGPQPIAQESTALTTRPPSKDLHSPYLNYKGISYLFSGYNLISRISYNYKVA